MGLSLSVDERKGKTNKGNGYDKGVFQQELTHFRDRQHAYALEFDKGILTFSSLALGLSMTFVAKVFDHPHDLWAVVTSWSLFGVSVIATLLGFWFAQTSYTASEEELITGYNEGRPPKATKYTWQVKTCTSAAGGGFVLGLLFLAIFVGLNIDSTGKNMSNNDKNGKSEQSTKEKKARQWRQDAVVAGSTHPFLISAPPTDESPSPDGDGGKEVEETKSDGPAETKGTDSATNKKSK